MEAVQRRAACYILNGCRNTSSVIPMLETLGWPTLEQRRPTCRLLMLYKIQGGLAHCPTLKAKLVPLPSRQRCTHDKQLTLLTTRTQYRGSSFLPKTIRDWDSLPMEVVEAPTLNAFVSRVSNWKATYISAQLSTDAVSALRTVWVLIRRWKQPSAQAPT